MNWLKKLLAPLESPKLTEADQTLLDHALVGKTIKKVTQVCKEDGWFIIYLKMTDDSAVHIISTSPSFDSRIRVQLDKDGVKTVLPTIPSRGN